MNIVLEDAFEVFTKTGVRRPLGRIMLKGDCVTLIQKAQPDVDST
jgi:small nuclear ribonucleoprotein E